MLTPVGSGAPLILPPRYQAKVLMPVPEREWRAPSQARQKDQFGNEDRTFFRVTGRLHDGAVKWQGWFSSRDDFDAFLLALGRNITEGMFVPRADRRLANTRETLDALTRFATRMPEGVGGLAPWTWGEPGFEPWLIYAADTVTFLTTTGSNQTRNKPSDWDDGHNQVEIVAGGASGAADGRANTNTTGGGAGEYGVVVNFAFPGASITYRAGTGGAGKSGTSSTLAAGADGTDSWWDGTTQAGSTLGAKAGQNGTTNGSSTGNGGLGGTGGVGSTHNDGGHGGNRTGGVTGATGGGAAGKPSGAGNSGGNTGSSGNTSGGTGSGILWTSNPGGVTAAAGSGSNGAQNSSAASQYGGASGGGSISGGNCSSGNGAQGIVVETYTPLVVTIKYPNLERLTRGANRGHHTGSIH